MRRHALDPLNVVFAVGLALVGLYMLAPIIFVIVNSFNSASYNVFPPQGFSLRWYENALSVPRFRGAFANSVLVGLGAMALALVLGTMSSFFFAPVLVPRIALGAALFLLYIRVGLYGGVLGLIIAHSLLGLPFVISIMTAVMYNIDRSQEEAAQDLGCSPIESFFRVTLPQLRTGLVVSAVFAFMMSFDELETSLFLVRPANNTLPIEMFLYVQEQQNPTLAALSTLLIALTVVLVLVLVPILKTQEARRMLARR